MSDGLIGHTRRAPVEVVPLEADGFQKWLKARNKRLRRWIESTNFRAEPRTLCLVPKSDGSLEMVLTGIGEPEDPFALAHLPTALPAGSYRLAAEWPEDVIERAALGWALGVYQFTRYRKRAAPKAKLVAKQGGLAAAAGGSESRRRILDDDDDPADGFDAKLTRLRVALLIKKGWINIHPFQPNT